jgi:hypothetical protein
LGEDTVLKLTGLAGRDSEPGDFRLIIFPDSVLLLGRGSGSRNRTVGGADLRLRFAPTDLEGFKVDFIDERFGTPADASLLADDILG